jgi:hypothetical protein
MYRIDVIYPDRAEARERFHVARASEILTAVSRLLAVHQGCDRLVVWVGATRLFAVDSKGNRLDD